MIIVHRHLDESVLLWFQPTYKINEYAWPNSLPHTWGISTGIPEVTITVTCGDKIAKFVHKPGRHVGMLPTSLTGWKFPTWVHYVHEDGIHLGTPPISFIPFRKPKDERTVIPWVTRNSIQIKDKDGKVIRTDCY